MCETKRLAEKKLRDRFIEVFGNSFKHIETEVTDTTKKSRIDLICYVNENVLLGIEFKRADNRKHGHELAMWLVQARRYSMSLFPNIFTGQNTVIPIFVCPSITNRNIQYIPEIHKPDHDHNNVNSFIYGGFGVGEFRGLTNSKYIFSINNYNLAELQIFNGKWKLLFHEKQYNVFIKQLNSVQLWQK